MAFFKKRFELSEKRLDICKTCDMYNQITTQCRKCGCFMAAKSLMQDASCPLGKWGEYDPEND